jgi:tetratricopeptide (TPR) repeat protein
VRGAIVALVPLALVAGGICGWLLHGGRSETPTDEPAPAPPVPVKESPEYRLLEAEIERLRQTIFDLEARLAAPAEPSAEADAAPEATENPEASRRRRGGVSEEEREAAKKELPDLEYLLERNPGDRELLRKYVDMAARAGEYDRSIERLTKLLEEHPDDLTIRTQLGWALVRKTAVVGNQMEQGRLVFTAIGHFDKALESDASQFDARYYRAVLNYHMPDFMKRTGDSIRDLETLVEQSGGTGGDRMAGVYDYLRRAYEKADRAEDAKRIAEEAARLYPGRAEGD